MVSVDSVYQKVLALTSKEQRGYITPQEFNLMADRAQKEIFDGYFHNFKTAEMKPKTYVQAGDELELLQEKLSIFKRITSATIVPAVTGTLSMNPSSLPQDMYRVHKIIDKSNLAEVQEMSTDEIFSILNHPLTKPTINRRVWNRHRDNTWMFYPDHADSQLQLVIDIFYYREPLKPKWGYIIASGTALYNSTTSTNFELHAAEEEVLVAKVLQLCGVIINKPEVVQAGGGMEAATNQTQND